MPLLSGLLIKLFLLEYLLKQHHIGRNLIRLLFGFYSTVLKPISSPRVGFSPTLMLIVVCQSQQRGLITHTHKVFTVKFLS